MHAEVKKLSDYREYWFAEGCYIVEIANDQGDEHLSIARARVPPASSTKYHMLDGVQERYIITGGTGRVEVGKHLSQEVNPGDIVRIPQNTSQRITNTGSEDLLFFVVCTPPFTPECYVSLEENVEDGSVPPGQKGEMKSQ